MATWDYTWYFDDPDDLDYWMTGQWSPAYGGVLVQNTAESGQSAGTVNTISTVALGDCSPGDVIVAYFDWSLYIYEQDYTPDWTVKGRLRFTDGLGNVLAVDTEPVTIGQEDSNFYMIELGATAPAWAEYVQLQVIWTPGNNFSSVYSFFVDSVYIGGTSPEPEPEPSLSRIVRTGFRFPHPRWSRRSTATNLLFLETQLEKYMHSHEGEEEPGVIPL